MDPLKRTKLINNTVWGLIGISAVGVLILWVIPVEVRPLWPVPVIGIALLVSSVTALVSSFHDNT